MVTIGLRRFRPPPMVADEVSWFFLRSASAVGYGSNFGPLADLAMSGISKNSGPKQADGMNERRIAAAERQGRVLATLLRMRPGRADVLASAYEPRQWEPQIIGQLGHELAGVAARTQTAARLYRDDRRAKRTRARSVIDWLGNICLHPEDERLFQIRMEAEQLLALAFANYSEVADASQRRAS
jgi:hypothetical protein